MELIAGDQVSKLNRELTKLRQESAGIKEYVWSDASDDAPQDLKLIVGAGVGRWLISYQFV